MFGGMGLGGPDFGACLIWGNWELPTNHHSPVASYPFTFQPDINAK